MLKELVVLVALVVNLTNGLYSSGDDVVELTAANFNEKVLQSKSLWLIEFYAPWCGHCKNLAPEWVKAAKALKGVVRVGAVNMDQEQSVGAPYNIQGFPTIKIFGANKNSPSDYQGARTHQAIVDEALSQLRTMVKSRIGGGSSGSSGNSGSGSSGDSKDVVELTESNFDSLVLQSDDMWLVEFFAPWCGHCKNLAPEWAKAATELKGKFKLGAVDATVHQNLAGKYQIRGYPTIKYFAPGAKQSPADYDGGRTSSDIVTWAMNKVAENAPAPDIVELLNHSRLEEACDQKQMCLIAFMPSLFDCQSKCRNNYISLMKKMGEKFKRHQWSWLWTEAGKHTELESALSVGGFGFPALVAVNSRKGKFVLLRGSFSESGINEFLRELSVGRGSIQQLPNNKMPTLSEVPAWDGKDAKIEVEEDINLDDVTLDDDVGGFQFRRKTVEEL